VCPGGDAPRTGMGRTTGFLGLGLLPMRMGVQDGRFAHRRLDRQNEKPVRKATRQGVRISCLRRTPESQEPQKLSHLFYPLLRRLLQERTRKQLTIRPTSEWLISNASDTAPRFLNPVSLKGEHDETYAKMGRPWRARSQAQGRREHRSRM
jgi:hypothetical protein